MKNAIKLNGVYFRKLRYIPGAKKLIQKHNLTTCTQCGSKNVVRLIDKKVGIACADCGHSVLYKRFEDRLIPCKQYQSELVKVVEKPVLVQPAEAVIPVRCAQCEYNDAPNGLIGICQLLGCAISKDGFCSYGIKREGEDNV